MKKVMCMVLALAMVFGLSVTVFAAENPFTDVEEGQYYYDAVLWAYGRGVTTGTDVDKFSPDKGCSRAEIVTFLWRAAGSPAPTSKAMPFTDVEKGQYYYDAVLWAREGGITDGTSLTTFSPADTCTRKEAVTFLWRFAGSTVPTISDTRFTDIVNDWGYMAILWAYENHVTDGTSLTTFSPDKTCTRAEIVTFLYRLMSKSEGNTNPSDKTDPTPTDPDKGGNTTPTTPTNPGSEDKTPTNPDDGDKTNPSNPNPDDKTDPPAHVHSWVKTHHDEVGHWDNYYIICPCGWSATKSEAEAAGYYGTEDDAFLGLVNYWYENHRKQFNGQNGHSYDIKAYWVIDTPAYDEWTCQTCHETTTTDPTHIHSWTYYPSEGYWLCKGCNTISYTKP